MRYAHYAIVLCALILAACAGTDPALPTEITLPDSTEVSDNTDAAATPAPADQDATAVPDDEIDVIIDELFDPEEDFNEPTSSFLFLSEDEPQADITPQPSPTIRPTVPGELPVPGLGTLVASETEDPDGLSGFENIILIRTGGPLATEEDPQRLVIRISNTGSISQGDVNGQISQQAIDTIGLLIEEMNFFGAQGTFLSIVGEDPTVFTYQISVERDGQRRTINAHEGHMPPELQRIVARIIEEGQRLTNGA